MDSIYELIDIISDNESNICYLQEVKLNVTELHIRRSLCQKRTLSVLRRCRITLTLSNNEKWSILLKINRSDTTWQLHTECFKSDGTTGNQVILHAKARRKKEYHFFIASFVFEIMGFQLWSSVLVPSCYLRRLRGRGAWGTLMSVCCLCLSETHSYPPHTPLAS